MEKIFELDSVGCYTFISTGCLENGVHSAILTSRGFGA